MNSDEALKCLDIAKAALRARDFEKVKDNIFILVSFL